MEIDGICTRKYGFAGDNVIIVPKLEQKQLDAIDKDTLRWFCPTSFHVHRFWDMKQPRRRFGAAFYFQAADVAYTFASQG